ncbi:MAG: YXWGXW repeat-containing protein [Candidatus Eremiobacteraeota bacterium]|nr:YXWGXW repeat-containing protein [Candidatus Eremiobacteraeota bacterium]
MMKSVLVAVILATAGSFAMSVPATAGYVYVQTGPPAAVVERVPGRPGRGYVWVGGYYRWYGGRYTWVSGSWVRHGGAWCQGHWVHEPRHGWYWTPGRWC